jgi:hypothetical protein
MFDTSGQLFLRGHRVTDREGRSSSRPSTRRGTRTHAAHPLQGPDGSGAARGTEFTSQIYFDDALSDRIYARGAYAANQQRRPERRGRHLQERRAQLLLR